MTIASPIIIDLGNAQESHINELLDGGGELLEEVNQAMQLVHKRTAQENGTRILVAIVAVYSEAAHSDTPEQLFVNFKAPGLSKRARRKAARKLRL
jgi:hypothetical protein